MRNIIRAGPVSQNAHGGCKDRRCISADNFGKGILIALVAIKDEQIEIGFREGGNHESSAG